MLVCGVIDSLASERRQVKKQLVQRAEERERTLGQAREIGPVHLVDVDIALRLRRSAEPASGNKPRVVRAFAGRGVPLELHSHECDAKVSLGLARWLVLAKCGNTSRVRRQTGGIDRLGLYEIVAALFELVSSPPHNLFQRARCAQCVHAESTDVASLALDVSEHDGSERKLDFGRRECRVGVRLPASVSWCCRLVVASEFGGGHHPSRRDVGQHCRDGVHRLVRFLVGNTVHDDHGDPPVGGQGVYVLRSTHLSTFHTSIFVTGCTSHSVAR